MRVRQKLALCFVPLITIFSFFNDALATCPVMTPGAPCLEYPRADAVFIGVANRVVHTPNNTGLVLGPYLRTTVYFTIEEAFKGVGGTGIVLDLDYCGHRFNEGERYLVYAHRKHDSQELDVRAGSTRTRPLYEAAEDLQYIRSLASAEPNSRVFGRVTQSTYNVKRNSIETENLRDVRVSLEGNNHRQDVLADNDGRYEFKQVPKGTYRIRAELPIYLTYDEPEIKVNGHECVPVDISARRKGQITGTVFDSNGESLIRVPVSLVPADTSHEEIFAERKKEIIWPFCLTTLDGRFSFSQLPPGRYLLIINRTDVERSRGRQREPALPRLFYPGVSDVSGATVIVVSNEDEPQVYDFRLPIP